MWEVGRFEFVFGWLRGKGHWTEPSAVSGLKLMFLNEEWRGDLPVGGSFEPLMEMVPMPFSFALFCFCGGEMNNIRSGSPCQLVRNLAEVHGELGY